MARAKRRKGLRPHLPDLSAFRTRRALAYGAVGLASCWVAFGSGVAALKTIEATHNPALVSRLTGDAAAKLELAQQEALSSPTRLNQADIPLLTRQALHRAPLEAAPLRMLALNAAARNDATGARTLALLSERVTRRDLLTQFMLIEQAVQADDYREALRHYDIALRTSASARPVLFPVLSTALADDAVRAAVVPYVRARANWLKEFIEFTMRDGPEGPMRAGRLLVQANAGKQTDLMRATGATLFGMLVDQRAFDVAKQLYLQTPGARPGLLQQASIDAATTNPDLGFLAWTSSTDEATGTAIEGSAKDSHRQVRVFAGAREKGVVLRRALSLPPGQYYLNESRQAISGSDGQAVWQLKCADSATPQLIWSSNPGQLIYRAERAHGPLIPAGCANQLLELTVSGGENPEGFELVIERFDLVR